MVGLGVLLMDERTFLKAWVLYSVHKRTLTQCAEALYDDTAYASVDSLRMGIYRRFRKQGLPLRKSGPQIRERV